ncbi:DNA-binding transcriptional MerR regulator [Paenibacillus cellulosilyticus]|uniref:DNA-binding transcriptional MerR regulator n=1 Tax=Paenibacillus cellulosilyticus TaxID=375489 RepID=A0A2V2YZ72_9BACL|nr:MerR family transcriptional regulator [Paenibacillus cellulosilyticus]PWW06571.1 DNA-binding transcriptional MerR regulator [Paenibacillus cellulosilyticus]QKS46096.1 MerR family transcriptional regulator [Paenibacillus cellulosilyticus]
MKYNSIGEVSAQFNIPESALRYYEKQGLLPLIERDDAGRRLFSERQVALLQAVVCFKNTHMPIKSIKQYMEMIVEGDATLKRRLAMMKEHKQRILDEIATLTEYLPAIDEKIERYIKQIGEERP